MFEFGAYYPQVQALRREERKEDGSIVVFTTVNEEKRLATLVAAIDADVSVVPRGAYHKTPTGQIEINPSFEGMPPTFSLRQVFLLYIFLTIGSVG